MVENVIGGREEEILPYDLIINILIRVPVKSLTRFKCVSKDWRKLIENPNFISQQLSHSASNYPLLLLERMPRSPDLTTSIGLIGPDFKVHSLRSVDFTSPADMIVGSCNGLLLIRHDRNYKLSLWNPATRQLRQVTGTVIDSTDFYWIGFGFSSIVNDYKIVRISHEDRVSDVDNVRVNRAEVYSLITGCWKEINVVDLQNCCLISCYHVTVNGAIFWEATMNSDPDSVPELVASFDIAREVFVLLKFPPPPPSSPTYSYSNRLVLYNGKVAMFRSYFRGNFESSSIDLWVLEDPNICESRENWVKKYSVGPFSRVLFPLRIWRDEIVGREERPGQIDDDSPGMRTVLSLFNPNSNQLKHLPANRYDFYDDVFDYAESVVPVHLISNF